MKLKNLLGLTAIVPLATTSCFGSGSTDAPRDARLVAIETIEEFDWSRDYTDTNSQRLFSYNSKFDPEFWLDTRIQKPNEKVNISNVVSSSRVYEKGTLKTYSAKWTDANVATCYGKAVQDDQELLYIGGEIDIEYHAASTSILAVKSESGYMTQWLWESIRNDNGLQYKGTRGQVEEKGKRFVVNTVYNLGDAISRMTNKRFYSFTEKGTVQSYCVGK